MVSCRARRAGILVSGIMEGWAVSYRSRPGGYGLIDEGLEDVL